MNNFLDVEIADTLLKIESFELLGDLDRRQQLIYTLMSIATKAGYEVGVRSIGTIDGEIINNETYPIPEWAAPYVAYIILPQGQIAYFMQESKTAWDGHTRTDKLSRIRDFVEFKHLKGDGLNV